MWTQVSGYRRLGLVQVSLAGLIWGTTGVVVQWVIADSGLDPFSIGLYRLAVAAVVLLAVFVASNAHRLRQLTDAVRTQPVALVVSGMGLGLYQALYFVAVANAGVGIATVVALGMAPVMTAAYESLRLRQPATALKVGSILTALVGLGLVTVAGADSTAGPRPVLGLLAAGGSGLIYSVSTVVGRHAVQTTPAVVMTTVTSSIGTLTLLPFGLVAGLGFAPTTVTLTGLAYLGVATTTVAYGLYYAGLRTTIGSTAAVLTLLDPVTAVVLAVVLLGEALAPASVVGTVLLLSSIAALYLTPRSRDG